MKSKKLSSNAIISAEYITGKKYIDNLNNNILYSLEIDPSNQYNFTELQKTFIKLWIEYRNIIVISNIIGCSTEECSTLLNDYNVNLEIKRLNNAINQKRFATNLLSIDQIEGYLTSMLTGENVPIANQIDETKKIEVAKLIMSIKQYKATMMESPSDIIDISVEDKLDNLSVETIKMLKDINKNTKNKSNKEDLINTLTNNAKLSPEDYANLSSKSDEELQNMIKQLQKLRLK